MSTGLERDARRLAIGIDPGLREGIVAAAAARGISVRDYVAAVLREALNSQAGEPAADQASVWSRLSVPVFARDWESDADAVYDDLA